MADASTPHALGVPVEPDEVVRRTFSVGFRGFDQQEVRAFLAQVAGELRAARAVEAELRRRIEDLEQHAGDRGEVIDEERLTAALGQEAGRLLQAARDTAAEVRERASADAAELRGAAERVLAERTAEADEAAAGIRAAAESDADAVIEEARDRGREMLAEAQAIRERILRDLARRRRHAHQQLEQLRAARERLLDSYRVVQQTVDEATRELTIAESEAKAAAEAAGLRAAGAPEASVAELEAEVSAARDVDLPIVDADVEGAGAAEQPGGAGTAPPEAAPPEHAAVEEAAVEEPAATPAAGHRTPLPPGPPAVTAGEPPDGPDEADEPRGKLRRLRRAGRGTDDPPAKATFSRLDPGDDLEGVRIIRPVETDEPAARADAPVVGEVPASVAPPPERAEGPAPEAVEPGSAGSEVAEPAEDAAGPGETPAARVEPAAPVGGAAGEPPGDEQPARTVEALFAKIRADRASTTAGGDAAPVAGEAVAPQPDEGPEARPSASADPGAGPAAGDPDGGPMASSAVTDAGATDEADGEPAPGAPSPFERRDQAVDPVATALTRALKRALTDEQNEVLDALRRHRGKPSVADVLPPEDEHLARYRYVAQPLLADAATAGASSVGGGSADAAALVDDIARRIGDALRERLDAALRDSGDDDEATGRVSAAYREWKSQRAEPLAGQLAAAAYSLGVYQGTGDDVEVRWLVDPGGRCGPDCDDNSLAGAVRRGRPFPTGHLHPPAHDGCRCLLAGATF